MRIRCSTCDSFVDCEDSAIAVLTECPSCGTIVEPDDDFVGSVAERPKILGHFELLEQIGGGQFGDVWKARDRSLDRIVAVKIPRISEFDHETLSLFLREARTAATLQHPHIVTVHEVGRDDGLAYIATDFIAGRTLAARLKDGPQPTTEQAAVLCSKLAAALHHAHQRGVIHRDVKPGNVMIDEQGEPRLMDFGLAKRDGSESTIAVEGEILGTAGYMPPEQARGDACQADARSDVYSLGIILYELLTGSRPFKGEMSLVLHKVLTREPPAPRSVDPGIPRDLETVCLKAIAKNPDGRYQTADAMAADLQRFLRGEPVLAGRPGVLRRWWWAVRRNRVVASAVAIALVAVCASVTLLFRDSSRRRLREDGPVMPKSEERIPPDRLSATGIVRLATNPPGAAVYFIRLNDATGEPDPTNITKAPGVSPVALRLKEGEYLVVVDHREGFHEVFRRVPRAGERPGEFPHTKWQRTPDGAVTLPPVNGVRPADFGERQGMSLIRGSDRFKIGPLHGRESSMHVRRIPSFYLQTREVSVRYAQKSRGQHWNQWRRCGKSPPSPQDPITCLTWDQAMEFAESQMMRLPTEAEYEFAATLGGTRTFPWGNDPRRFERWQFGPVGEPRKDCLDAGGSRPVFGLYSNVAEWTTSRYVPYPGEDPRTYPEAGDFRVIRGGPETAATGQSLSTSGLLGPRERVGVLKTQRMSKTGFRFARSAKPRIRQSDFEAWLLAK